MMRKGFTLVEVTISVVLLLALFGLAVLYSQTSQLRADLNTQAASVVSYLRLAQSNAASGHSNRHNAIHFESTAYTTFLGNVFNPTEDPNFTIDLPPSITITNVSLNGGGGDIIFTGPEGGTNNFGSFDLFSGRINKSITINISQIGAINY